MDEDQSKVATNEAPAGKHGSIGTAVLWMRHGRKVQREGWNGKGMWLGLQTPDEHGKITEPYVFMKTVQGGLIPWLCSQADLLADDWQTVE